MPMTIPSILEIDGSFGEGGGQIARIASAFSIILGRPIRVSNVRAGRSVPGLRPQHAATLQILRDVCGGSLEGGTVGSTEFTLYPGRPTNQARSIDMRSAASITLVLQTLAPAIALSKASLDLELRGGTDVPWSPTSDYVRAVVAPCFQLMGIEFSLDIVRRGYYPRGGGTARVHIAPSEGVRAVDLSVRGAPPPISLVSRAGMLPERVAERQIRSAVTVLTRNRMRVERSAVFSEVSSSPGTSILISAVSGSSFIGSDSIGARGRPAEQVGMEAAERFVGTYASGACVDPNLADMVAPVLCLASEPSNLLISSVTGHLKTGLHVAKQFMNADYRVREVGKAVLLTILPPSRTK